MATVLSSAAEVLRLAGRVRVRTLAVQTAEQALTGALVGCLAALPILAAGWLWPDFPRTQISLFVIAAASVVGAIRGLIGAPSTRQAAARLDLRAGLRSEFVAAVELAGVGADSPFVEPLCRRAVERFGESGAAHTRLGDRGPGLAKAAGLAAAAAALFVLIPAGAFAARSAGLSDLGALAESLEPHARNLSSGGGEGAPTPEAIRRAIEQLRASGKAIQAPDIDPERAAVELMKVDEALRAALAALPREPIGEAEKQRWDEFLRRAEAEIARRLREAGRDAPAVKADDKSKAGGKSNIGGGASGSGGDVSAGAGGKAQRAKTGSGSLKQPAATAGNFEQMWESLRHESRPAAAEGELNPRYRELVRGFFR